MPRFPIGNGWGSHDQIKFEKIAGGNFPGGVCTSYFDDGGGLSITPAPVDFGQQAMRMALTWVDAPKGAAPPSVGHSPHFRVGLRVSLLAARGIKMPAIYIEAARIGNSYAP
ncbi:MAG: hypothetical protein PHV34_06920 [Verrucomicrobiae bacterium]|nr:hypothetical protein [Verrucomicrobiae bacterium]